MMGYDRLSELNLGGSIGSKLAFEEVRDEMRVENRGLSSIGWKVKAVPHLCGAYSVSCRCVD